MVFSFLRDTWNEVEADSARDHRVKLGSVLRKELKSGSYRYGIMMGEDCVISVKMGKVCELDMDDFNKGGTFWDASEVEVMGFNTSNVPYTGEDSARRAVCMLGKKYTSTSRAFALYCRTGGKTAGIEKLRKIFSSSITLDTSLCSDAHERRKAEHEKAWGQLLDNHRNTYRAELKSDLKATPYSSLLRIALKSNRSDLMVSFKFDGTREALNSAVVALSDNTSGSDFERGAIESQFQNRKQVIDKAIKMSNRKWPSTTGIYKRMLYIPEQDQVLQGLQKS